MEQQLFTIKEVCDSAGFPAHRVRDDPGRADSTGLHRQGLAPDHTGEPRKPEAARNESKKGLGSVLERFGLKLGQP